MTQGAILPKLIRFALPMMLSNILQLTFAAADSITVGRFAGEDSLAAVGATVSLISLITNCFLGISVGANVAAARYFGAKDDESLSKTVHTTFSLALITGVLLNIIGFFIAPELLVLMKTPDTILPLSTLYLRIYFVGIPATVVSSTFLGLNMHYFLKLADGTDVQVIQEAELDSRLADGEQIHLRMKQNKINIFCKDGSRNLVRGVTNDNAAKQEG
jgi:Na+-driven multidrug efflux pump